MAHPPEKGRSAGFLAALTIGWVVLAAAGMLYARAKNIPAHAAIPLLGAFLAEYPFYLVLAFPLRERFAGRRLPLYVLASALLPYLIASLGATEFTWLGLVRLAALALAIGLWYIVLPSIALVDLAFLAVFPAVLLGGYNNTIYLARPPFRGELPFLAHFVLIQMATIVLMVGRKVRETGFGFIPTWREWRIGAAHYVCFVAVGLPLALTLGAVRWRTPVAPLWSVVGTFVGFLWVVALSEEFFLWGVLREWLEDWTWSRTAALGTTAVVFGLLHLWFGGAARFPNWRWAAVATLLGIFCGLARNRAGGIRAAVVTHSLVVATFRAFFVS